MDRDKKIGAITMTVSVILAFAFLALSDGWYPDVDYIRLLMATLEVRMFRAEDAFPSYYYIHIQTKYLVLLCLIAFSVGLLLYRGIIQLPARPKNTGELPEDTRDQRKNDL